VTLGLAVLATTILYGCWRLDGGADSRKISVALMAASSHPSTLDDAACQSVRGVDFLLWPEEVLGGDGLSQSETIQNLLKCANRCQSAVMIGWSRNTGLPKLINSAAFVRAESRTCQFYEKTCLVPWAEQVPSLADLSASLGSAESRATDPTTFELKHATIGPAICFDVCLPETLRRYRDCDLIAVCGSEMADSTGCLRELMLQMARLRAVEFRRPIARSVKAGYSGVISSSGAMLCKYAEHGLREPIRVEGIALGRQTTLYSILGIWSPAFTLGAIVLAVWASARFHNVMRLLPAKQHRTPVNRDISGEPCLQEPRTFRRRHY
jgi:apolipoprotein N-acyltransferase